MRPDDVVSPISLTPTDLDQFQKAWVLYLEREGITADRQPMVADVADYCLAMGITFSYPHPPTDEPLTPAEDEDSPPPARSAEDRASATKIKSPILTPEQDALVKAPWTREDVAAWKKHCAQGERGDPEIYPERYTAREITNFIRGRRGVPLLPPDPPREPMRWEKGTYTGMTGIQDYQRTNDGFKRPGTSQYS